jgi:opacity protein-like surface antigen
MGIKPKGKIIISLIIAFILILPAISHAQKQKIRVVVRNATVRMQPNMESEVILNPPVGSTFEVENKLGDWYEIKFSSEMGVLISGYIHSMFVNVVEEQPAPVPQRQVIQQPAPQVQAAQRPATKVGFKLKMTGGYGTIGVGDYNTWGEDAQKYMDDLINLAENFGWSGIQEGEFKKINLGMEFEGEAILTFGSVGIGGGFGLLKRDTPSELSVEIPDTTEIIGGSMEPNISVLSVYGNLYLFLSPPPLNFYLYGGAALYSGKITSTFSEYYEWPAWQYSYRETSDAEATSKAIGFHAGAGIEFDLSPNLGFFLEAKARFAKLTTWEGTYDYEEREVDPLFVGWGGYTYSESGDGTIYFYEEEDDIIGNYYATIIMSPDEPSGFGVRNVEEFTVDLTGFSVRVGITIKF